ncbi:MAG: 1,4-dihydroxy-2-naphthoate octaprenyltransferase [bacterium]|nr:1,4-dihydroxy-2-naphthoate octaprenyltransferase [bacterium]
MSLKIWIQAARLRTLPLAIAGAIAGNLMAYVETRQLNNLTFLLSVLTGVFLQILSNYANDYGDFKNGADTKERTDRVMASGLISESKMKFAIAVLIGIILILGIALLTYSIGSFDLQFWMMFIFGVTGIIAAYFYTAGSNPYGYIGLGDSSVFIFFGILAVMGTYYLQVQSVNSSVWWMAAAVGLMSVGVLNVNNIRDIESDQQKNKITIPVMLGYKKALQYHVFLLVGAIFSLFIYVFTNYHHALQLSFLITIPLLAKHYYNLSQAKEIGRPAYNQQLKFLSLYTLMLCLVFCFSQLIVF